MNWIIQTTWVLATAILAGSPDKNNAYLDPGSGSFIFQLILASILGGIIVIRAYWKRITAFVKNIFSKQSDNEEE